jgi:NodT family efflux transporter outer membrane factor (OMF) lipoprotein
MNSMPQHHSAGGPHHGSIRARRALALLGTTLVLQACQVGPDFKRPATPDPQSYLPRSEEQPQATARAPAEPDKGPYEQRILLGSPIAGDWWGLFQSQPLSDLIRQGVAASHTLAAAQATIAEAREYVAAEAGGHYPQLSLSAGAGRQQYGQQFLGFFTIGPFSYTDVGLSVNYLVDYTGGLSRSIEQRQALAQYQESQRDAAYLTLTGAIAAQAVRVAALNAQIGALAELLSEDQSNVDLVSTAFKNGSVSRVDVLTAQSQLASDQTLMPPLRHELAVSRHALAVLVGQVPGAWSVPDLDFAQLRLPRALPVTLPSELVHRRPDILAAEAQLHAATAAVGVATSNLYPQIMLTATGSVAQTGLTASNLFSGQATAWSLISGLTAPLFDGGTLRAKKRAAVDELRATSETYQETVLRSFGEVADVLDAIKQDSGLVAAQSNALQTAESSLQLARESYRAGNSGLLQILDVQRQRQEAQLGLLRAQAQQYLDTIMLMLAVGGTLQS